MLILQNIIGVKMSRSMVSLVCVIFRNINRCISGYLLYYKVEFGLTGNPLRFNMFPHVSV